VSGRREQVSREDLFKLIKGNDNRLVIGVTGGIATGKSTVTGILVELGATLFDCDKISRKILEPGKPAWEDIVSLFGKDILLEDETINRKKLGNIVFNDSNKRRQLEEIQHIRILAEIARLVEEHVSHNPNAIILVDVPLLIEVNWQAAFRKVLIVYITADEQINRLMERDNIDQETAMKIIRSQMGIEEKRDYGDFIIDNTGSLEETRKEVTEFWKTIVSLQQDRIK
jgi:dephospho-CoA kinase